MKTKKGLLVLGLAALTGAPMRSWDSGDWVFLASPAFAQASAGSGGSLAAAAAAAGFKPVSPGQMIDLTPYLPANPLPPGVKFVSFHTLSDFVYQGDFMPWTNPFEDPKRNRHPKRKIPAAIRALDGKRIAALGFMLPFDFHNDGTSDFGLLRNQAGCCFGQAPALNEWISVRMAHGMVPVDMDVPLLVVGVLHVRRITEAGNTMGCYAMSGETVEEAKLPGLTEPGPGPGH